MTQPLQVIEIQTQPQVQYSIIWMHGLGASADDFVPIVPELKLTAGIRFVFPNAPIRPITINNGYAMRGWYDILSLNRLDQKQDEAGLLESKTAIEALITKENDRGIPSHHIFLAGFSQGCAMALLTGLRYPEKLAGIIALSGYLPLHQQISEKATEANKNTPIFWAHGDFDPIVPLQMAQMSHALLTTMGYPIEWHQYPMEHQVCLEEVQAISAFIQKHTMA
ncbi:alpha/beta hydrolase [Pelistega europaea]|uniref:Carboxylesterase n=1 Tax=Pelistega europaea TaxID=106147 RepID=A0A7Y4P4A6_9BURK|nr:dienelactone hydrolase family protein [Pelistega europaea]NOL49291.1 carboxylesterase [Pelistega europaea]